MLFDIALLVSATLLSAFFGHRHGNRTAQALAKDVPDREQKSHVFRFKNSELVWASETAQQALSIEDLDEDVFHQLTERLSLIFEELPDRLDRAVRTRNPFCLHKVASSGAIEIDFSFDDDVLEISVYGLDAPMARHVLVDLDRAEAVEAELNVLRGTVATSPVVMWRETASGQIDWANRAYLNLMEDSIAGNGAQSWPPPRLFETPPVTKVDCAPVSRRTSVENILGAHDWFEVTSYAQEDCTLNFAVSANATVRAEGALRDFMNSLTQTFAQLSVGLAVFDHTRRLVIFNPALPDLTGLRPEWLSARPTLLDFLDQMRERRALPERKNFAEWRNQMTKLEQSVSEGTYCESWTLPNGQTYRVTGRPHPKGAIAFVLEDITAEISLTRRFRQELKLSKSIFDSFPEAIAVFSRDGTMTTCNAAYRDQWGPDPQADISDQHISLVTQEWDAKSVPTPIWGEVRDFVTQTSERAEWQTDVALIDGRQMACRVAPLANGATLIGFLEKQSHSVERVLDKAPVKIAK